MQGGAVNDCTKVESKNGKIEKKCLPALVLEQRYENMWENKNM